MIDTLPEFFSLLYQSVKSERDISNKEIAVTNTLKLIDYIANNYPTLRFQIKERLNASDKPANHS